MKKIGYGVCLAVVLCGIVLGVWRYHVYRTSYFVENDLSSLTTYGAKLLETEPAYISVVAQMEQKGECLVWYQIAKPYADADYIPVVFTVQDTELLRYFTTGIPHQRVLDIAAFPWQEGYSFLICAPDCTTLQLTRQGESVDIPVETIPFSYYTADMPEIYTFLDRDGNCISQGILG